MTKKPRTPFDEGYAVGTKRYGTWFDCPYTGLDLVGIMKRREWLRGFDAARAAGGDASGNAKSP